MTTNYTIKVQPFDPRSQPQREEDEEAQREKKRRDNWVQSELHSLKYGCRHEAWVQRDITFGGEVVQTLDHPVVRLANDDDGHYVQNFHSREELDRFIVELRYVADEAWGKK